MAINVYIYIFNIFLFPNFKLFQKNYEYYTKVQKKVQVIFCDQSIIFEM